MSGWRWVSAAVLVTGSLLAGVACFTSAQHYFYAEFVVATFLLTLLSLWRPDSLAPGWLVAVIGVWWLTGRVGAFHPAVVAVGVGIALAHGGAAHLAGSLTRTEVSRSAALLQLRSLVVPVLSVLVSAAVLTLALPTRPDTGPIALLWALLTAAALIALLMLADRIIHRVDRAPARGSLDGPPRPTRSAVRTHRRDHDPQQG